MTKKKKDHYIRSVDVNLKHVNNSKKELLRFFLEEYRVAMINCIDYFWTKHDLSGNYSFNDLQTGSFYPYSSSVNKDSILSGRSLKSAETQAMGMINSAISKQYDRISMLLRLQSDPNVDSDQISKLQRKIHKTKLIKPSVPKKVGAELNSINLDIIDNPSPKTFNLCFDLKSLFRKDIAKEMFGGKNKLPLLANTHKRYHHWTKKDDITRLNSVLINAKTASVRFKIKKKKKDTLNTKIAIDQGMKTCITAIDQNGEYQQSIPNNHGYDLDSIAKLMIQRQKGTKSYQKAIEHRKNYVNWCVNQLNLEPYDVMVLEHVYNIGFKQVSSEYLKKFPTKQIKDKLQSACEENGVRFELQKSAYRSQRCSDCGFVHSQNRKAKIFCCKKCGFSEDSDINAAANHLVVLPDIDRKFLSGINKTTGFYWNPDVGGVYTPIY